MTIDTLVPDIQKVLLEGVDEVPLELVEKFGKAVAETIAARLKKQVREPTLRMSNIGQPCERKLYLELNDPEDAEPLTADTKLKFAYGDLIEELLLFLAEVAGHKVEGRQSEQSIAGIKGHRDAVIDGVLTDVKSASSYSFNKFKNGELRENDAFGYITQIQSYLHAGQTDDLVTDKERCAFLVADKTLGHLCLDVHKREPKDYEALYEAKKETMKGALPKRAFQPEPDGKSGNYKLPINCAYCPQKFKCHDNIRTFMSYKGPVFLTKVAREPRMLEITNGSNNDDRSPIVLFQDEGD